MVADNGNLSQDEKKVMEKRKKKRAELKPLTMGSCGDVFDIVVVVVVGYDSLTQEK